MLGDCAATWLVGNPEVLAPEFCLLLDLGGSLRELELKVTVGDRCLMRGFFVVGKVTSGNSSSETSTVGGVSRLRVLPLPLSVVVSAMSCLICAILRECGSTRLKW